MKTPTTLEPRPAAKAALERESTNSNTQARAAVVKSDWNRYRM